MWSQNVMGNIFLPIHSPNWNPQYFFSFPFESRHFFSFLLLHRGQWPFESQGFTCLFLKFSYPTLTQYLHSHKHSPLQWSLSTNVTEHSWSDSIHIFCPSFQFTFCSLELYQPNLLVTTIKTCLLAQLLCLTFSVKLLFSSPGLVFYLLFVFGSMMLYLKSWEFHLMKLWENSMFCHKRFSKYLAF